jgi:hypothetical protein
MFLYQKVLSQPLTMREIWLPGKGIKANNTFWMVLSRQLLAKDKVYPDSDVVKTWERIRSFIDGALLRFDMSGFGFQFPREYLEICASVISELYPMSEVDEQFDILSAILKGITVTTDSGVVKPLRGIGLGYYEDLKTMTILSILKKYDPISVYGDQGLLKLIAYEAIFELQRFQFIVEDKKVEWVGSTECPTVKWAGATMSAVSLETSRRFSDNLLGAFFSRFHWERKLNLRSISRSFPEYRRVQKILSFWYEEYFGWEFHRGESTSHFDNGGINMFGYTSGYTKLYKVQRMIAPYDPILFDPLYLTPFKAASRKTFPWKQAKDFSKKRKEVFKHTQVNNSICYDYVHPRVRMQNTPYKGAKILPGWADLLYIARYGRSSGSFTFGLSPPAIRNAYSKFPFSSLPTRCQATGGYRVLTRYAAPGIPTSEDLEECELLVELSSRSIVKVRRCDLHQDPYFSEDPLYWATDLVEPLSKKRKTPPTLNSSLFGVNDVRAMINVDLSRKMARGEITRPRDIRDMVPGLLDLPTQSSVANSFFSGDELDDYQAEQEADDILMML